MQKIKAIELKKKKKMNFTRVKKQGMPGIKQTNLILNFLFLI